MSLNQLFLGALALQQSPLPLRWPATIFGRQAVYVNRSAAGLLAPDEANYQLQGWAKLDDQSGPGLTIKLKQFELLSAVGPRVRVIAIQGGAAEAPERDVRDKGREVGLAHGYAAAPRRRLQRAEFAVSKMARR